MYTGPRDHSHLVYMWCRDGAQCPKKGQPDMAVPMGPITGLSGVARELMRHLGYEPSDHPAVLLELEQAIGEETLDLGRQVLAEHGLPVLVDGQVVEPATVADATTIKEFFAAFFGWASDLMETEDDIHADQMALPF